MTTRHGGDLPTEWTRSPALRHHKFATGFETFMSGSRLVPGPLHSRTEGEMSCIEIKHVD